jgi:phage shock protein PspC (stress-responsive transcriptional regulator)
MNRIVQANIGGQVFDLEEPAYKKLDRYLMHIRKRQATEKDAEEILPDMEQRIAEHLKDKQGSKPFIDAAMVDQVIGIMGVPDDYYTYERKTYDSQADKGFPGFTRDTSNKWLGGVCSGLGNRFDIDPLWMRLAFLVSFFIGGAGFLIYIILWILVPAAKK